MAAVNFPVVNVYKNLQEYLASLNCQLQCMGTIHCNIAQNVINK